VRCLRATTHSDKKSTTKTHQREKRFCINPHSQLMQ
jgi:hypothetical protein